MLLLKNLSGRTIKVLLYPLYYKDFSMLLHPLKLIEIFCQVDDFVNSLAHYVDTHILGVPSPHSVNKTRLSNSEIMTIEILYHLSGYKCFEYYYTQAVEKGCLREYFPDAPSYSRFIYLKPRILPMMILYLQCCRLGMLCGLYYADSTTIKVCNNRRINNNKVFKGKAERGKSSMGWFFGFKLFLVVNAFGEIVKVMFNKGNVADNNTETMLKLFDNLNGLAFADKGFINQKAFEALFKSGIQVITGIKSNMKNKLMPINHKLLLRKRGMIESVNDILKTVCDIEHTSHRSPVNAVLNIFAGICAYTFLDRFPSIFTK